MTLEQIGRKFNTDKSKHTHDFLESYEAFLDLHIPNHRESFKYIVEVGIFKGESLMMWQEYYQNAHIVGIDINIDSFIRFDRIKCMYGDQDKPNDFVEVTNGCDMFIDDGSHMWSHQIKTFDVIFPTMKKNSIYILEDAHTSFVDKYPNYNDFSVSAYDYVLKYCNYYSIKHSVISKNNDMSISIIIIKN